jgi:ribonucleoside-diphosphate reductase alpha chain
MSVNLYSFVENPFTDKAFFNYDKFKDVVYKAQRLMDDVVDLEEEKINKILNKIENDPEPEEIKKIEKDLWTKIKGKLLSGRRTGLSAIGLADCLAALNVTYGSEDSIKLVEKIYKQFAISAYKSSIDMAKERGAFPIHNIELEKENPFLKRFWKEVGQNEISNAKTDIKIGFGFSKEDKEQTYLWKYKEYGRRNIALLTIPPSGTISQMASISSGIEPVYQLLHKRRYKILGDQEYDYVDKTGDKWREYTVLHPKFKEWFDIWGKPKDVVNPTIEELNKLNLWNTFRQYGNITNLETFIKISPYYNSTAYEIDPIQRVKLQATIQKWIDHSISSTINLPKSATEEEVSNLYIEAWKQGCKGITIYRDGCREGILTSINQKDTEFKQHDAPKRPKSLPCNIHSTTIKGEGFYVLIGLYENKPYEVFVIRKDIHYFTEKEGIISKLNKKQYDIQQKDSEVGWIMTEALSDNEATITRLVSTALRHGTDIKFITEQLNKTQGDLTNFGKAIARVLSKYIKKETGLECPECKQNTLIRESGCIKCTNCGYSKCN